MMLMMRSVVALILCAVLSLPLALAQPVRAAGLGVTIASPAAGQHIPPDHLWEILVTTRPGAFCTGLIKYVSTNVGVGDQSGTHLHGTRAGEDGMARWHMQAGFATGERRLTMTCSSGVAKGEATLTYYIGVFGFSTGTVTAEPIAPSRYERK
jgi:hypothetical protein